MIEARSSSSYLSEPKDTCRQSKPLYLKIYENTRVSAIVATPIFFIIYVVLKIAFRKKKVKF